MVAQPFSFRYHPVLGTELHLVVNCETEARAEHAQEAVLDEIVRLEGLLSTYRADTPLSRWMHGETGEELPDEIITVLALAQDWFVVSEGAFHPGLGRLRARWRQAEQDGRPPSPTECRELAALAEILPFAIRTSGGVRVAHRTGDCSSLDLDAFAKGWIVDRAAELGTGPGVGWVMVNVGGDLRLAGSGSVRVAIENPTSTVDNAPPLAVVTMTAGGLASSGSARRGFQVADRWFGHVLDPRTGWPVESASAVTVIAPDTGTADVLATVIGVDGLDRPHVMALLEASEAAALVVTATREVQVSDRWREQVSFDRSTSG